MFLFDEETKIKFAEAMVACNKNPLDAGQLVFPNDFNKAAAAGSQLVSDTLVKAKIKLIEEELLKTKGISDDERYIETELKSIINSNVHSDSKIKAIEKLMDLKGLSKKQVAATNVNVVMPRAIEIPTFASDDDWEKAAAEQQRALLNVSRNTH